MAEGVSEMSLPTPGTEEEDAGAATHEVECGGAQDELD